MAQRAIVKHLHLLTVVGTARALRSHRAPCSRLTRRVHRGDAPVAAIKITANPGQGAKTSAPSAPSATRAMARKSIGEVAGEASAQRGQLAAANRQDLPPHPEDWYYSRFRPVFWLAFNRLQRLPARNSHSGILLELSGLQQRGAAPE